MLDERDIQAIKEIVDSSVSQAKQEIAQSAVALMDLEFRPQFNLMAENIAIIMEKLSIEPRVAALEDDMSVVKAAVRANRADIDRLKEAM